MAIKKILLVLLLSIAAKSYSQCTFTAAVDVTIVNPTGCYHCDGGISVNSISGGTSPYTYTWSNFEYEWNNVEGTNIAVTGLCNIDHYLIIKDSNSCLDTIKYNLIPPTRTITYSTSPNSVCGSNPNGSVTFTPINLGTNTITYYINSVVHGQSFSSTSPTFTNLFPDNYTLEIEDSLNCSSLSSFTIEDISSSSLITLTTTITDNNVPCDFVCNSTIEVNAAGGTAPYNYIWSNGSGTLTNQTITGICRSANYTLQATDAGGCSAYKIIDFNSQVNIHYSSFMPNNVSCGNANNGSIIILNHGGGLPPFEYSITPIALFSTTTSVFTTNTTFNFLAPGEYVVEIKDGNNCPSPYNVTAEVLEENCTKINGQIFNDVNNNCFFDAGDIAIKNYNIIASNGTNNYADYSDLNGNYEISGLEIGTYTIFANPIHLSSGLISSFCVASYSSVISSSTSTFTHNFAAQVSSSYCGLYPSFSGITVSPGFNRDLSFSIVNDGFVNTSGLLSYTLPNSLTYNSSIPSPISVIDQTIVFSYTNLSTTTPQAFFTINVYPATSLTIGTTVIATLNYEVNCTDVYSYSNPYLETIFITGPYDPNHKMVSPSVNGTEGGILKDEDLTYTIEFQNIGSAPAVNVVVIDTLSSLLDESSIRQLASSYPNNFIYNSLSRQMQWRFNNINLPDSTSDPEGSKGHFVCKVKQKSSTVVGDVIKNTAHIYFDFNSAIVTNTTKSTIVEPTVPTTSTPLSVVNNQSNSGLTIYPNPSTGIFNLVFNANFSEKGKLTITDIAGKTVKQQEIELKEGNNVLQINSSDFSSGAYFVSIQMENKKLHQKVIIQK